MNELTNPQLIYSAIFLVCTAILFNILKHVAKKTQTRLQIRKSRYFAIRRMLAIASIVVAIGGLIFIWGVSLRNVWITVSSALAVVAIAFFAIWSLVGNILAGMILYFTSPFKIEDTIEIMPDEIRGTVLAINTFYTVLLDTDDNYINVPNSMFFQKYIQVKKKAYQPTDDSKNGVHEG